ncbi:hypothetical protein TSUD_415080 [Trifolium subterraneum]|uniref:Aminotransferase-like plant mobile domain-containing protein n=1 Tax=Trifolium subterraneum TaxID=3900 RepID=A0A2Z6P5N6_TRISU|nr:hypothetical protein TSUD_415080 [Trifolium subterraneum]
MASSSHSKVQVPVAAVDENPITQESSDFISEPTSNTVNRQVWEKQVMIPHILNGNTHAFAGPYPDAANAEKKIKDIFPCYPTCEPRIFVDSDFNMSFLKPGSRVLRSAPSTNAAYIKWLDKVQAKKDHFWRRHNLFDLIQLSREEPNFHTEMIIAALHFWERSTCTFHFKMGMMTPTLFDIAAIIGLRPIGPTFNPKYVSPEFSFDYENMTFSNFIQDHHITKSDEVSDEEHIAFLTYWLSHFIFCTESLHVVKRLVPMAIQIHEGKDFAFGKLILATLYDSLGKGSDALKKAEKGSDALKKAEKGTKLKLTGPMWFLQLWLNATFESNVNLFLPPMDEPRVSNRQIEGSRLALLRQRQTERQVGPAWFKQDFPATNPDDEENINEIWLAFLSPTVLSSRLGAGKQYLGLVGYQPNLVARQSGFSQFLPKSLFKNSNLIVLGNSGIHEEYFDSYLKDVEKIKYDINSFAYSNSLLCTLEFADWWSDYYKNKAIDEKVVLQRLNTDIDALGLKVPKSKVVSSTSTATTKQAKPKNSSTSTASGVSTRVRKIPASKDIPEVTETRSRKRETSPVKDTGKSKKTKANQLISTSGDTLCRT